MRSLFVSLLFLFASGFALAQVNVGFRAAYGQSNLRTDDQLDLLSDQFSSASSTNAGLYVELPVSEVFSLRSGLEINRRGTSLRLDESVEVFGFDLPFGATAKTRFTYVDVPLLAQVHVPTGSVLRPYAFGGASLGYATGGNIRTTARAIIDFNLMTTNIDLDAINYERFHVAALGGVGVKAEVAQGFSVFAEGRYEQSLTQPYDVPVLNAKTGFKGFNFGAGVAFTLQ
ncbi:outer membrane beta-barrel protein [Neolewinella lacunae]|uniref:PorT family protein n=1 Tax=Neolewinella lacunae TaxID=1517758 RepID=A0A923TB12_9BACT|nr:outer membrane beta-barrel protein [Neolewinella lacunae]MBC6996748.1 PorT family protein [Neolewinella lacunae]MDN3633387.1 outer membrane beta-barrel protein [Neolewinella lacunae]